MGPILTSWIRNSEVELRDLRFVRASRTLQVRPLCCSVLYHSYTKTPRSLCLCTGKVKDLPSRLMPLPWEVFSDPLTLEGIPFPCHQKTLSQLHRVIAVTAVTRHSMLYPGCCLAGLCSPLDCTFLEGRGWLSFSFLNIHRWYTFQNHQYQY